MKNGDLPIEIVDLPIINGDFPVRYVNVYQRVTYFWTKPFDGWLIVAYPLEIKHGWKKLHLVRGFSNEGKSPD